MFKLFLITLVVSVFSVSMVKADLPACASVATSTNNSHSFLPSSKAKFFSEQSRAAQWQLILLKKRDQRTLEKWSISYGRENVTRGMALDAPASIYFWIPPFLYRLLLFPNHYFW